MRLAALTVLGALVGCGAAPVQVTSSEAPAVSPPTAPTAPTASPTAPAPSAPEPSTPTAAVEPPASPAPSASLPKEIGARHVLVQFLGAERAPAAVVRTREQAESLAQKVLAKARRDESFTRLATEYSDEPGAAGRGGALGRFTRGRMVPAFEEVAFRLRVGQVSDIVETPFGFHVILRTE